MSDRNPIADLLQQIARTPACERRARALWQWRILAAEDADDYPPGHLDLLRINCLLAIAGRDRIGHG